MFNPDNFSKTEILYKPVTAMPLLVEPMIKSHFPGYTVTAVLQLDRKEINSANYQVAVRSPTHEQTTVLLREFRTLTDIEQIDFYLGFVDQLYKKGVHVSKIIKTIDGAWTAGVGETHYVVFDFIDARYFTPTETALASVAKEIAKMHIAFDTFEPAYVEHIESMSTQGKTFFNEVPSVLVSDVELIQKILEAKKERTETDTLLYDKIPLYIQTALEIEEMRKSIKKLPKQIFHSDLHPHNILLEKKSDAVAALVDFDSMRLARMGQSLDVAYAIYRLGKQFFVGGGMQDADIKKRAIELRKEFVAHYSQIKTLSNDELRLLPLLCKEEMMKKLLYLLKGAYLGNNIPWLHELPKFIPAVDEINFFWE